MRFASSLVRSRCHETFRLSAREQIMARGEQYEPLIHTSTLGPLTDGKVNAKRKSRLNDQIQESAVLVDGMPRF